jgi:hypothetical protein
LFADNESDPCNKRKEWESSMDQALKMHCLPALRKEMIDIYDCTNAPPKLNLHIFFQYHQQAGHSGACYNISTQEAEARG